MEAPTRKRRTDFPPDARQDAAVRLVGIEVKESASPSAGDFRGRHHFRETVGKRFLRGILLYTGSSSVAFGPDLHAVPVSALWRIGSR